MVKIVVDTNVLIDYLRIKTGPLQELISLSYKEKILLYCSSITVLELYSGQSSKAGEEIIEEILQAFTVVVLDKDLGKLSGELRRNQKLEITTADLIIAATALSLDAQLATNNVKHFSQISRLKFFKIKK